MQAYAQTWLQEGTGGIVIDQPTRTANAQAAAESLRDIRTILAAAGIPARGVTVRPFTPPNPRQLATIKLNYARITADAGPCGLWPEDLGPTMNNDIYANNRPYSNLGCAYQRNMAAMVANPSDLIQPRAETPSYTKRRMDVFDKYSKGQPTATESTDADKAKLSDVGK